jgi:hypothetical protein
LHEIISERRATSNRDGGRHHRGFAGDFARNQHLNDFFAIARPYHPHAVTYRYDRPTRRLSVSGDDPDCDIKSIGDLIQRGIIPANLDAITHTAPSAVVAIIRGRHLAGLTNRPLRVIVG